MNEPLTHLCQLYGIATTWTDIWGHTHEVTPETQRALLAAMHVRSENDDALHLSIDSEERRRWQRPLPPVHVIREGQPVAFELRLPRDQTGHELPVVLTFEDTSQENATVLPTPSGHAEQQFDGIPYVGCTVELAITLTPGYHRLDLPSLGANMTLIVAPRSCYWPAGLSEARRVWGPSAQLYAVRSRRNWGIGDFGDLRQIVERFGALGAGIIGVNPLHALFPHNPSHASPYSPSSRLFLNVLYVDVEGIPDFAQCAQAQQMVQAPEFRRRIAELRARDLVDYTAVMDVKLPVLEILFQHFREHHFGRHTEPALSFHGFVAAGGQRLHRHVVFEALQEHFRRDDGTVTGWSQWPEAYRNPDSKAVAEFSENRRERVEFFAYLQWQADRQLAAVGRLSFERLLDVGLYQDLSLSVDRSGAEAWANQDLYATDASIGSPPDDFNLHGQNWGLPPMIPQRLYERRYAPFIETLRANMRHAGALRIDHVMGLMRLFWIPDGASGSHGAYIHYPFADLLGIVALESHRNHCIVVGEDLGTVPDEVREAMKETEVLSYRLFYFERARGGEFLSPGSYPQTALVAVSTHDLPTLAGFWKGEDLRERDALGSFPNEDSRHHQALERSHDRARILRALEKEHLLPHGVSTDAASCPDMTPELVRAIHEFTARTPARLLMVQLEDIVGQTVQVNLPGTSVERPNWRLRLPLNLEDLLVDTRTTALASTLVSERGGGGTRGSLDRVSMTGHDEAGAA